MEDGRPIDLGDPCGFVLEFENGLKLYNAGDTAVFGDMSLIGTLYEPDVAILPIGDHFTMGPKEAAKAIDEERWRRGRPNLLDTEANDGYSADELTLLRQLGLDALVPALPTPI